MKNCSRRKLLGRNRKGVYHCSTRCVRRAYLCGRDPVTKKDFSHRRRWIINREEQLAGLFGIEIEFRAEMSNHLHLVLRTRPEVVKRWSNEKVVRRWLTITRLAKSMSDSLPSPDPVRFKTLMKSKNEIKRIRRRLSCISWFMSTLCENIARRANKEDGTTGRFWEFKCRVSTLDYFGLEWPSIVEAPRRGGSRERLIVLF